MNVDLTNIASANGTYNGLPTSLTSTAVVTQLISGLTITKTANKQVWADGNLIYSVTITNNESLAYVAPVITDVLDPTLAVLVENSVYINGILTDQYTYNAVDGTLTVTLPDIEPSSSCVITFQVSKK